MTIEQLDQYISDFILTKNPIEHDVEGAPFKIGQKVKILDNPNDDETFDMKFANKIGKIRFFEYESGCGQTFPRDPMISVRLDDGKAMGFGKKNSFCLIKSFCIFLDL